MALSYNQSVVQALAFMIALIFMAMALRSVPLILPDALDVMRGFPPYLYLQLSLSQSLP